MAAVVVLAGVLVVLPGRSAIPPLVESDYCYQLISVERASEGLGFTSLVPVAPLQPWSWRCDFAFLTKWPIGYALMVWSIKQLLGVTSLQACQLLAVFACACAPVGWFLWIKRCVPGGVAGGLVSVVAAGCSVSTAALVNPMTDTLLVAALPFVLLGTSRGLCLLAASDDGARVRGLRLFAWVGLACGALFWIRYASLFVPLGIGAYLALVAARRRGLFGWALAMFLVCTGALVFFLVMVNSFLGVDGSVQAQLNLGHRTSLDFSVSDVGRAWWKLSTFGFYSYRPLSHWVFAGAPLLAFAVAGAVRPWRKRMWAFLCDPAVGLSVVLLLSLLGLLVSATAVFGDKYDYVGLDRYYMPVRPIYFMLLVAPAFWVPWRVVRVAVSVSMLVAASWLVQQEWPRPYRRWLAADREAAPSGAWATCFSPGAAPLYGWICDQASDELVIFSNFHEYITLETKLPALPIPPDQATLEAWVTRIRISRGLHSLRVLFVLDVNNRLRDYWVPTPEQIVSRFGLSDRVRVPPEVSALVYAYPLSAQSKPALTRVSGPPLEPPGSSEPLAPK